MKLEARDRQRVEDQIAALDRYLMRTGGGEDGELAGGVAGAVNLEARDRQRVEDQIAALDRCLMRAGGG